QSTDNPVRIQLLRKSLAEQPSFAGHYQLGKALRSGGQLPQAIQEFRAASDLTAVTENVDRAHALFQIGATLAQQGNDAEGLIYTKYAPRLEKHPAVEQAILPLKGQLAGAIQSASKLERAFVEASRDLRIEAIASPPKIPVWIQFEFDKAELAP